MAFHTSCKEVSDLLKAFGVDPSMTTKFQLTMNVDDVVTIETTQYADKKNIRRAGELITKKYKVFLEEKND